MYYSRYSRKSPSESSATSNHRSSIQRSPIPSDYEYLGRLVTRERPIVHKSKSTQQDLHFPQDKNKYQYSMGSHDRERYRAPVESSSGEETDDIEGLSKPLGVIRISDRHYREIYRLPTPPPKVKRVFHRLQSPEPKIIERVYVRRPAPQIIENVIEVPSEKVRIIHKEKYLEKSAPITRSKLVHLKSRDRHRASEQQHQQFEENYRSSDSYVQQQTTTEIPATTINQQSSTQLVYPPQPNMRTVGYVTSTIPPDVMFNSQEPIQIPMGQMTNQQVIQSTPYDNPPQQTINQPMIQSVPQQINPYQMMPSTPYNPSHQSIQPVSQQVTTYQMGPSTAFSYPSQVPIANPIIQPTQFTYPPQPSYGFTQFP